VPKTAVAAAVVGLHLYILPFWGILLAKTVILVVYALMEFLRYAAMLMFHRNPLGRPPEVWI
jgi:hypothetical protein